MLGQQSFCESLNHPASSFGSGSFLPNHFPSDGLGIDTDGMLILNCLSFLLLRRYSFNSLFRSAIVIRGHVDTVK